MCGIAGWFGPGEGQEAEALVDALRHRGPDGSGIWQGDGATMVHTRLAILDLSESGAQPMVSKGNLTARTQKTARSAEQCSKGEGGELTNDGLRPPPQVLVFNGEIYNHAELRSEIEQRGEVFTGNSDTEVLLNLLLREGSGCLTKLAGMFAFCFWDNATGEALLARDAFGIKPLYYRIDGETLAFASETRVLRRADAPVDVEALRDFFLWGSVPEPATLDAAIRQLPAGHLLRWKKGHAEIAPWHEVLGRDGRARRDCVAGADSVVESDKALSVRADGDKWDRCVNRSLPDWIALTRAALLESMRRHLVADVPVGIFLSGGIDSTVVLALAREVLGPEADIRTFSIGFDDPEFDESSIARRTAEHFGARHTEWRMTPEEGAAEIPAFLAAVDQPSIDGFNTWCVSKLARREGMKVVLSGLGGDEIFAGYGSFTRVPRFHRLHQLLGPLRVPVAKLLNLKPPGSPWRRLAAYLRSDGSWLAAFHAQRGIFTPDEAAALAEALAGTSPSSQAQRTTQNAPATTHQARGEAPKHAREIVSELERTRYMRNQLLRDSDVFSMAHGLELRVPFVDVRLAETLRAIPPAIRLRQGKKLLLEAVPEVPEWVWRQRKRGFRFPFQQWMEGAFGELMDGARRRSPVPLNSWYRTWAMTAAVQAMGTRACLKR